MGELRLPDNIKVHFAACEVQNQYLAAKLLGIRYALFTAFPFVERMVFAKAKSPLMPFKWQKDNPHVLIPKFICENSNHVIQDSGLFTLMFGSRQGINSEDIINKWYDALVEFTLKHQQKVTCVEIDCQKILGVEKAWEFRERIKNDLPNRIINVFHHEDGQYGLDRLIEFSDYIALSVPELRRLGKKEYVYRLAYYIKNKKPEIDIHLLGCTELELLNKCKFCTSCDSTSWISGKRFGYIRKRHISGINDSVINLYGKDIYNDIRQMNSEINSKYLILSIHLLKQDYYKCCGYQDYLL